MEVEFFPGYFKVFHVSDMVNLCCESEGDAVYRVFGVSGNFAALHWIQILAFKIFANSEFRKTEKASDDYCQSFFSVNCIGMIFYILFQALRFDCFEFGEIAANMMNLPEMYFAWKALLQRRSHCREYS